MPNNVDWLINTLKLPVKLSKYVCVYFIGQIADQYDYFNAQSRGFEISR